LSGGVQKKSQQRSSPHSRSLLKLLPRPCDSPEAGHILYLRILYPIHIQAPKKDIISYHYHSKKKDMDIYPISFVKIFASIVTVSEQPKARPGITAAHKSSTFYRIELKP
jgi:hypothetical protein